MNALGLLLRMYVRGELDLLGDRLKIITDCVKDQVSSNQTFSFKKCNMPFLEGAETIKLWVFKATVSVSIHSLFFSTTFLHIHFVVISAHRFGAVRYF